MRFRAVVNRVTYKTYMPRKEELLHIRLRHLKSKKMQEYAECIKNATAEYNKIQNEVTKQAAMFIDIDQKTHSQSLQEACKLPEVVAQLGKDREEVRL